MLTMDTDVFDPEELVTRITRELDKIVSFCQETERVREAVRDKLAAGHAVHVREIETGREFDGGQQFARFDDFPSSYLLAVAFQHVVRVFEDFLFDLLKWALIQHPERLAHRDSIDVDFALSAPNRFALLAALADEDLIELKCLPPRKWLEYSSEFLFASPVSSDEIESFCEAKACADALAHGGIVSQVYVDAAGARRRWMIGETIVIDQACFDEAVRLVRTLTNKCAIPGNKARAMV